MSSRDKLLKAASILGSLADEIEKSAEIEDSLNKLKKAGIVQTDDDAVTHRATLSGLDTDGLKAVTQSLLDIADKVPVIKTSSLGKAVIAEQNTVRSGEERWSGWHSRIMNL